MASTLHISLPELLKDYVDAQAAAGEYPTPDAFVLNLIQEDFARKHDELEDHLLSALEGQSEALEITPEDWENATTVERMMEWHQAHK